MSNYSDLDTEPNISKSKKREKKADSKPAVDEEDTKIRLYDVKDEPEIADNENQLIQTSLRNFYKLEVQKVTLQICLKDPSKPDSEDNVTKIKGQTILQFNLTVDQSDNQHKTRDLRLDFH